MRAEDSFRNLEDFNECKNTSENRKKFTMMVQKKGSELSSVKDNRKWQVTHKMVGKELATKLGDHFQRPWTTANTERDKERLQIKERLICSSQLDPSTSLKLYTQRKEEASEENKMSCIQLKEQLISIQTDKSTPNSPRKSPRKDNSSYVSRLLDVSSTDNNRHDKPNITEEPVGPFNTYN